MSRSLRHRRRWRRLRPGFSRLSIALLVACAPEAPRDPGDSARRTVGDSAPARPPGYVVDSALPIAEALERFRRGVAPVNRLEGGATSRDELVARFVSAVEHGDTAALRQLELTRAEFAYLFFPSSIYTRPPYEQPPDLAWMLSRSSGERGYRRLVARFGGRPLGFGGYECAEPPLVQGANTIWRDCALRFRAARGDTVRGQLFGAIMERDGRFKFMNYTNDL